MTLTLILKMTEYHILPLSSNITLSLSGDITIIKTAFLFHDLYYYLDLFIVYVFPFHKHLSFSFHPFLVYIFFFFFFYIHLSNGCRSQPNSIENVEDFSLMVLVFLVGGTSQEPYDILLTYCNPTMVLIKLFWLYLCMQLKSSAYSVQITFQAIFK